VLLFDLHVPITLSSSTSSDFKGRGKERSVLSNLIEENTGSGLCSTWYMRRFLQSVKVQEEQMPHSGLGLQSYVQWSSPIRRFSDLQVHASVKRFLRRRIVYEMIENDLTIPQGIKATDLGISPLLFRTDVGILALTKLKIDVDDLDSDLNFFDGLGLVGAGKSLQRQSQQYWILEHVRRLKQSEPGKVFIACVLGCIDPVRQQYAVYIFDLGFEHRYISPIGRLEPGSMLRLTVDNVNPRADLLQFVRVV
jgi:RNB domain